MARTLIFIIPGYLQGLCTCHRNKMAAQGMMRVRVRAQGDASARNANFGVI
jgi:hypothetical protein